MNARTSISLPNSSFYPMFTWFSTFTQVTNFYNPFFSLHVHVSSGRFNSLREYIEFPLHVTIHCYNYRLKKSLGIYHTFLHLSLSGKPFKF